MKHKYFLATVLCTFFVFSSTNAQFIDDFDWVDGGTCPSWWTNWSGTGCDILGSNSGCSGIWSGHVPGDPAAYDPVLDLGNKIFGMWRLKFCMYIPSNKEGYFNLQGTVPIAGGEWIVGNIFFNQDLLTPGEGLIDNSALGAVTFNFPHDEWFDVEMVFDINSGISLATWEMLVDDVVVIPAGTAFTNSNGDIPASLGGVNFFSISANNEFFLDYMIFDAPIIGVEDFSNLTFAISPNPAQDELRISTNDPYENVRIHNMEGKLVMQSGNESTIDISVLQSGMYFVEISSDQGKSVRKLVKR
ncbi:MAG: hypothetical protein Aureis2KO_17670 [Aureisphaera sp.]